ncbi:hypothetical protein A2U01_0060870, partial [Trifolium medium]|nr:hypothetical protein [Trifolium medium]
MLIVVLFIVEDLEIQGVDQNQSPKSQFWVAQNFCNWWRWRYGGAGFNGRSKYGSGLTRDGYTYCVW